MVSEKNCSHARTRPCLQQKVALEDYYTKEAVYQGGHVWGQFMCPQMILLNREDWW